MADEGVTTWPNTACGRPVAVAGQAFTTTWHHDALSTLLHAALTGDTLEQAADAYAAAFPLARRLDVPVRRGRTLVAGVDGRPL